MSDDIKDEKVTMDYKVGDEISVSRGKHRKQTATVLAVDEAKGTYAVKFADGSLGVVNAASVKAPVEGTVTVSQLAELIYSAPGGDALAALETNVPGFTAAYDALVKGDE